MPIVRFEREQKTVEVEDGENLRYVALDHDIPIYCHIFNLGNCHGNGMHRHPELRLACQVEIHGDITVITQCGNRR
jgi:ferredoxin